MINHFQKSFSALLAFLLVLMSLSLPGAQTSQTTTISARPVQETMPDGLMDALMAASAQPFEASAASYRSHAGGLDFTLDADGLKAINEGLSWGIALSGFGRGERITAVSDPEITQTDSRLELRRAALTEWYRDTALGLEQGFTIHQSPHGAGPLVVQLELSSRLAVAADADWRGLTFTSLNGQTLRYDQLRAWDANGVQLDAKMLYSTGKVMLQVDDTGAAYPLTIDPLIALKQKVTASGEAGDRFGYAVALSGNTALVGAYYDDIGLNQIQGSAYLFIRSGTTWILQQQLTATDGAASDGFGSSVALSGDSALVGAFGDDVNSNLDQGSAYVFVRSGTAWSQQQKLTASDGAASDSFGKSVALSGDTALVGANGDNVGEEDHQGSAYVFVRNGTIWSQQQQLTASDGSASDFFGGSVALSGNTALVGANMHDVDVNTWQGAAFVFTRSEAGIWAQQQELTGIDSEAGDSFGYSVALSGDNALVGANLDHVDGIEHQGSAYVFTQSGATWTEQAHLTTTDGAVDDYFGNSVALSGDTALVGAWVDDVSANSDQGSATVFRRSGTTWAQQEKLTTTDGAASDYFGASVALSGNTALVGAFGDDVGGNIDQGSAAVFTSSGTTWTQQEQLTGSEGSASDNFGISVAIWSGTALVGAYRDDVGANTDQGSVYVFKHTPTGWNLQQKLTAADGAADDWFGRSVALSGGTALVGAVYDDVDGKNDQGSAYVFIHEEGAWKQQAQLIASNGAAEDNFGISVALSGESVLVGAARDDILSNIDQGSAYVFTRSAVGTWTQEEQLIAKDGEAGDYFGNSVAISGDTALVGAYLDDFSLVLAQGSAYVFTRSGIEWKQQVHLAAVLEGHANDNFGYAVALAGDTALIGAYRDDVGSNLDQGSAYIFTRSSDIWSLQQKLTAADGAPTDKFGCSLALSNPGIELLADTALIGACDDDIGKGSAYIFSLSGASWMQQQKLTAPDGAANENFGYSVALFGYPFTYALVGAYKDDIGLNYDQGSAYFYDPTAVAMRYLPLVIR